MRCSAAPVSVAFAPRRAACRAGPCRAPALRAGRAVASVTPSDDAPSAAPAQLARRDALALAAAAVAAVAAADESPAYAAGVELGLRRIGRSAKFDQISPDAYKTLPSGLKYYDVVVGGGKLATAGDRVALHYDCKLRNLTISTSRVGMGVTGGVPYGFDLGTKAGTPGGPFIEGINQGVVGMQVGGQRKIIVPPELGYGKLQVQEIPPNATLYFDLELLSIKKDNPFGKGKASE